MKPGTVARSIGDGSSFWMSCSSARSALVASEIASPGQAGAAGAADAVDVVLRHQRQVEVHDQRQLLDVEPARGHVGGDEHRHVAGLEVAERALARALASCRRG